MTSQLLATVKVHWLDPEHGGRKATPSGPIYAATGQFTDHGNELFSVILRFLPEKTSQMQSSSGPLQSPVLKQAENKPAPRILDEAELGFLAPELIEEKLAPGVKFLIAEGSRIVAECEIQSANPH